MNTVWSTRRKTAAISVNLRYTRQSFHDSKMKLDSGGIRTHASKKTGAQNQRLRPLGHATR